MSPFDSAHALICELIADFTAHQAIYMASSYSEAQARVDFIDKFWTALGWDVSHNTQKNPYEQEVRVEKTISVGGQQKRADYAFHLAPNFSTTLFFVEAKKPFATLDAPDHCFQLVRYAWNAGCPLSILHDFEELLVLDCRWRPDIATAQKRIWKRFHYTDFEDAEKFRFLYHLFSREAALEGALAKRAAELPKPRGKSVQRELFKLEHARIDEAFLDELEQWRADLAKAFKRENPELDSETLTEVTQRTLDRLVFLRFLEDKGIEQRTTVGGLGGASGSPWADFQASCHRLDRIYNGAIFRYHPVLDANSFTAGDDAFGGICEVLDAKNSVYDFNVIPIHILGSIYERFLGSVIIATDKRARVEQKPEVRKAGGVYYTPEYIVRYIVQQTVGKQIEGKTPAQIESLRFADIACGSGSFLLGVFDCLLRYHSAYYNEHPKEAELRKDVKLRKKDSKAYKNRREIAGDCFADPDTGALRLTLEKKRQILLNNVFGTDLDPQAVEVAQFSLYLKLLEDETAGSTHQYQLDFEKDALLPALEDNLVCGNALIGTDIAGLFSLPPEEEEKLRPMDYETTFPQVFGQGGFDAIVGNPPYVRPHNLTSQQKEMLWSRFETFSHKSDLYCCFVERVAGLLRNGGRFSYIVSKGWQRLNSFQKLRRFILQRYQVDDLVEIPYQVFDEANVLTDMFVFTRRDKISPSHKIPISRIDREENGAPVFSFVREIPQTAFHATFENVFDTSITPESDSLKSKMRAGLLIGEHYDVCFGLKTGDDSRFLHHTPGLHAEDKPLLRGENVKRYSYTFAGEYVWYDRDAMREHRMTARPGEPARFEQPKVLVKDTSLDFSGTYDHEQFYVKDVLIVLAHTDGSSPFSLKYVAGIINSKALKFYYRTTFQTIHVQCGELSSLPLPALDLSKDLDRARHDKMVNLVTEMLEAQKQKAAAVTDAKRDFWTRKATTLDRQIDALVYELYGLTPEEIALVEGTAPITVTEVKEATDE